MPRRWSELNKLLDSASDFEKAVIYYNMGFAHSATENYGKATEAFAKALALNALPQQQHEQLQYNLGQLYIAADKPRTASDAAASTSRSLRNGARRGAHLPGERARRSQAIQGGRSRRSTGDREGGYAQGELAADQARDQLRAEGLQGVREDAGAADRHRVQQARILEAALEHVLPDEVGRRRGRGAGAGRTQGFVDKPNESATSTTST